MPPLREPQRRALDAILADQDHGAPAVYCWQERGGSAGRQQREKQPGPTGAQQKAGLASPHAQLRPTRAKAGAGSVRPQPLRPGKRGQPQSWGCSGGPAPRLTLLVAVQVDNLLQVDGHGVVPVNAAEGRTNALQGRHNSDPLPPGWLKHSEDPTEPGRGAQARFRGRVISSLGGL